MGANSAGEKMLARVTPANSDTTREKFREIITRDLGATRDLKRASFRCFFRGGKKKTG